METVGSLRRVLNLNWAQSFLYAILHSAMQPKAHGYRAGGGQRSSHPGRRRNKYTPHQGKQEKARRVRQRLAAA